MNMVLIALIICCLTLSIRLSCLGHPQFEVYYITPSRYDVCPKLPCLTLSQFINYSGKVKSLNISLIFRNGHHLLDCDFSVKSLELLSMKTYLQSDSAVISCLPDASFNFKNFTFLFIKHLNFVGCGNNKISLVQHLQIEESTFTGRNRSATALNVYAANFTIISDCVFTSNYRGSYSGPLEILKMHISHKYKGVFAYAGGAIIVNSTNVIINSSRFEDNSAEIGGAIFSVDTNMTILNSSFIRNYVRFRPNLLGFGGVLHFETSSKLHCNVVVKTCEFHNNCAYFGGAISTYGCSTRIDTSLFDSNSAIVNGGVMEIQHNSKVVLRKSTCTFNTAIKCGGVFSLSNSSSVKIVSSHLFNNTASESGGVVKANTQAVVIIINSTLRNNVVNESFFIVTRFSVTSGGVICLANASAALIDNSQFHNNAAGVNRTQAGEGGVMEISGNSNATITGSKFHNNWAQFAGGVLYISNYSVVTIYNCKFFNNTGYYQAGVIDVFRSSVTVYNSSFCANTVNGSGGGIVLIHEEGSNMTAHHCTFMFNSVNNSGGVITASSANIFISESLILQNEASSNGGAVRSMQCNIIIVGSSISANSAAVGGAIYAYDTKLQFYGHTTITNNTAMDSAGGIYLYRSEVTCHFRSTVVLAGNSATNKGGGIYAIITIITVLSDRTSFHESYLLLEGNQAQQGGGIYLETASELHVLKSGKYSPPKYPLNVTKTNVYFVSNSADFGGGVYIEDETNFGICRKLLKNDQSSSCFLQVMSTVSECDIFFDILTVNFSQNSAKNIGNSVFGGLLDRCTINNMAEIRYYKIDNHCFNGICYLKNFSNIHTDDIGSYPVELCFCDSALQQNCTYNPPPVYVKKGENFTLSLFAVDQVGHVLDTVAVYASVQRESGLGVGQMNQTVTNVCTTLNYSILSPYQSEDLLLYAEGPCKNAGKSQKKITVRFLECTCPVGFQPKVGRNNNNCECVCDSRLLPYIADPNCISSTKSVVRRGNFWITYLNNSHSSHYLIYPHCPFDYCQPPLPSIAVDLSTINGSDVQCAYHRSGLLCGICKPNYSLSLGSSHCVHCPKSWPIQLMALVLVACISGLLLILILLVLNLTVAIGTMNGIIFYVNVIDACSTTFFPNSTEKLYVFFSWLNLKVGFDICFFVGMSAYWKTWLQLTFPIYVIFLVFALVYASEHSTRLSRLLHDRCKNPVATLATLVWLSYTMFLRTIIAALSFAKLTYGDGSHQYVWLPDATVEYLSGKHVILFVVAIIILTVGSIYTGLLFCWQWILCYQNKAVFKWIRHQKLQLFIQTYNAPYKDKHRYWTGLLLLSRVVLYIAFALNISGDPGINLLIIVSIMSCILCLKGYHGQIYKKWTTDTIDLLCYLNLTMCSAAMLYATEAGKQKTLIVYISGAVTVILLLMVVIYHTSCNLCLPIWKRRWRKEQTDSISCSPMVTESQGMLVDSNSTEPTFSVIEAPCYGQDQHNS